MHLGLLGGGTRGQQQHVYSGVAPGVLRPAATLGADRLPQMPVTDPTVPDQQLQYLRNSFFLFNSTVTAATAGPPQAQLPFAICAIIMA